MHELIAALRSIGWPKKATMQISCMVVDVTRCDDISGEIWRMRSIQDAKCMIKRVYEGFAMWLCKDAVE